MSGKVSAHPGQAERMMMTGETPLDGIEVEIGQKPIFDAFLASSLKQALISWDLSDLPPYEAVMACKTNAEVSALYAQYHADLHAFLWHATMAHFMIRLEEVAPPIAWAITADVKDYLDSGDAYTEWIWDWATTRGIDAEAVTTEARAKHAAWLAGPTRTNLEAAQAEAAERQEDQ
jgi:hypothetical protein